MKKTLLILFAIAVYVSIQAQTKVTFFTTEGRFVVEIYDNIMPITGGNFLGLVNQKFYDGIIFHRVINNFMIQGGDPTGTGSGGSGVTIQDEFHASLSNLQKHISMANSGPNTGTSQFFINLVDNTYLDPKHPVFGKVVDNFNVVQAIGMVPTGANDKPVTPVVMDSIRVGEFLYSGTAKNNALITQFKLFPNPGTRAENCFLIIQSVKSNSSSLSIYDSQGKLIETRQVSLAEGVNRLPLNDLISHELTQGIYFINLNLEGQLYNQTMILK